MQYVFNIMVTTVSGTKMFAYHKCFLDFGRAVLLMCEHSSLKIRKKMWQKSTFSDSISSYGNLLSLLIICKLIF